MAAKPPAISGVSSQKEAVVMTVYPSIASIGLGKTLGAIYDSIPATLFGIKISHLLFVLPTAPIALKLYLFLKVFGETYVLTNRSVQKRVSIGNRLLTAAPLSKIDSVHVRQESGQAFYPAADLDLLDEKGDVLMTLPGVPRADVFRQTILEARDARRQVEASLARIQARPKVAT